MKNQDLELYTTEELIKEIVNRSTFAGIIIKSVEEVKLSDQNLNQWEMIVKNISADDAKYILNLIQENMTEEL